MKWVSPKNMEQVARCTNGNLAEFSAAVNSTFSEVYENLDVIDKKAGSFSYSPENETLTFPIGK